MPSWNFPYYDRRRSYHRLHCLSCWKGLRLRRNGLYQLPNRLRCWLLVRVRSFHCLSRIHCLWILRPMPPRTLLCNRYFAYYRNHCHLSSMWSWIILSSMESYRRLLLHRLPSRLRLYCHCAHRTRPNLPCRIYLCGRTCRSCRCCMYYSWNILPTRKFCGPLLPNGTQELTRVHTLRSLHSW